MQYKTGTQSIKITSNSGANAYMTKTVNWDLSGSWNSLQFWFYVHNETLTDYGNDVYIWLSNDSGFTNYFKSGFMVGLIRTGKPGWRAFVVPKSYFNTAGSPSWANPIVRVRFGFTAATSKVAEISFDDLVIGAVHIPAIIVCFDDGYASQYTAFQYMKNFNMRGNIANNTGLTLISAAQYREVEAAGWAVCNHTNSSTDLSTLSEAEQEANINGGKNDMIADGLSVGLNYLIYPSGGFNADTLTACTNTGMVIGRVTGHFDKTVGGGTPILPSAEFFQVQSQGLSLSTVAEAETLLDNGITDGMVMTFHWHNFGEAGQWTLQNFYDFVDYVRIKILAGQLYAITYDDYYKLTIGSINIPKIR